MIQRRSQEPTVREIDPTTVETHVRGCDGAMHDSCNPGEGKLVRAILQESTQENDEVICGRKVCMKRLVRSSHPADIGNHLLRFFAPRYVMPGPKEVGRPEFRFPD